jgi:hypothetical protein
MRNRLVTFALSAMVVLLIWGVISETIAHAGQGAGRMLYTVPNSSFIENPAGDSGVKTINDTSGSIATLQASINTTRSTYPSSIIVVLLTNNATYWVSSAGLVLGSHECLAGSGAVIKATNASVTVPLIQISSGSTNISVAGIRLDGNGANINGILTPAANRVNVDRVTVVNCGLEGIFLNGNGNTNYDNEMTVTRCEVAGCSSHAGISIQNATQAACLENYCHNNAIGIGIGCAYSTFANNVCNFNSTGIYLNSGNDNVIANNTCNYNSTGIFADGTNTMIVSDSLGNNATAGINSSGSRNIYSDNLFTAGNSTNFINGGSSDKIVAYQDPLSASGQAYFYPPLINNQHTNTIVNGMGRTDLTINSTTIDNVQTQYNTADMANPTNVIVLHLNGTFTVGANPLTLSSNTCVLLNGTIQVNGSTTASSVISDDGSAPARVSISGGIIDGGNNTNMDGISFLSGSMIQVDSIRLQNFATNFTIRGASDVLHFNSCGTPVILTRCTITNASARGIWLQQSSGKCLVSDNEVTKTDMYAVDCDSYTSGAVVKFNYLHDLYEDGVFIEQAASHNLALGNICNNYTNKGFNLYNNGITNASVQYNSVLCNWCFGTNGLRNGSTPANSLTSHNFFFNNTLVNAAIQSQNYGTQNYYSQNYQSGASVATSGTEAFFNSPGVDDYVNIQDANSFLFAVVTNASTTSGAAVILGSTNSLGSDLWQLVPTDSGCYQIKNKNSGMDMNVTNASTSPGALVVQNTFGSAKSDQWLPVSAGNGRYFFTNRLSGLNLDVTGAGTNAGTRFDQQPFTGVGNQQFNLNTAALARPVSTNLTYSLNGPMFQLQWPVGYTGWFLQEQTNLLMQGFNTNWADVRGSQLTNQWPLFFQPSAPAVFFRLRSP